MKITLNNKTHWRDDHIRAFISRQMLEERPDLCRRGTPALHVKIVYTRRNGSTYSSGEATVRGNWMKIRLSKRTPDKVDFAMVIAHELAHTRGAKDEYMMRHSAKYGRVGSYRQIYAWANELPLEVRPRIAKQRPQPDAKLAHCERMLKAAMTREKRATTLRKKWEAKVKYYSKKITTMEVPDEQAIAA